MFGNKKALVKEKFYTPAPGTKLPTVLSLPALPMDPRKVAFFQRKWRKKSKKMRINDLNQRCHYDMWVVQNLFVRGQWWDKTYPPIELSQVQPGCSCPNFHGIILFRHFVSVKDHGLLDIDRVIGQPAMYQQHRPKWGPQFFSDWFFETSKPGCLIEVCHGYGSRGGLMFVSVPQWKSHVVFQSYLHQ